MAPPCKADAKELCKSSEQVRQEFPTGVLRKRCPESVQRLLGEFGGHPRAIGEYPASSGMF